MVKPNYGIHTIYYKYSTFPKNICDIYHVYHVFFFHVHFHVYTYNTERLNPSVSQELLSSQAKEEHFNTNTVLLGHTKNI